VCEIERGGGVLAATVQVAWCIGVYGKLADTGVVHLGTDEQNCACSVCYY
jgi:hypothetical protein